MVEVISENSDFTIVYHPELNIVHHTFHQHVGGPAFHQALDAGTEVLYQTGSTKWLSDDRLNTGIERADAEWALYDWGPRTADIGWKYWALVVPESMSGRADMAGIVEGFYNIGVTIRVFTGLDEAFDWLNSV